MFSFKTAITKIGLGDNCVSKRSSDSFSHTKYMSSCVENSQNHTLMFFLFSNPREKVWKARKTMGQICPIVFLHFMTFSQRLETNIALQCSSDSFPQIWWYIFCVWKIVRNTFWRIVVSQSRGDCSIMSKNCMEPRSESATETFSERKKMHFACNNLSQYGAT